MLMNSFYSKFSQKFYGLQQVIHINDLLLMKQTCFNATTTTSEGIGERENSIKRLYEIKHPYYFIEYYPKGSDSLQQICSLVRLTSYSNACHRIKTFQALSQFSSPKDLQHIVYMDHRYLLLKNRELIDQHIARIKLPQSAKQAGWEVMGKYREILEGDRSNHELKIYLEHFRRQAELNLIMQNKCINLKRSDVDPSQIIVKNFNTYKLLARPNLEGVSDEQLIESYVKLILSNGHSSY